MIHSGGSGLPSLLGRICSIGHRGVQLFFLLSAYLTYASLEKFFIDREFIFANIKRWWIKKIVRLIPLYYLAIVICAIANRNSLWLDNETGITLGNWLSHILFLHGFVPHYANSILGVEWYIGVLVIFYLVAPYVYRIVNSWERAVILFVATSFGCSLISHYGYLLFKNSQDYYIYKGYIESFGIMAQVPVLLLGILFFYITKVDMEVVQNKKILSYALLFFAIVMLGGQAIAYNSLIALNQTVMCAIWFFLLAISQHIHTCVIIDNSFFRTLGKYSWPIYLFHYMLIDLYNGCVTSNSNNVIDWGVKYVVIVTLSWFLSWVLVKYVDIPSVNKINIIIKKYNT